MESLKGDQQNIIRAVEAPNSGHGFGWRALYTHHGSSVLFVAFDTDTAVKVELTPFLGP